MAIALSELRNKAQEAFPGFSIELDNGQVIRLRPVFELSDDELDTFSALQKKLSELDESEDDLKSLRSQFVEVLSFVADRPEDARPAFEREKLNVVIYIFREYANTVSDAAKSESDS